MNTLLKSIEKQHMNLQQAKKLAFTIGIFFTTVLITLLVFKIPFIENAFSAACVNSNSGIALWILVWLIIFLECSIIPGSYLPFLIFFTQTPLANDPWFFVSFVTSAVFFGRIAAYYVGRNFAGSLLRWAAGNDFGRWTQDLIGPQGKVIYAFTVAAPAFPDFILALLAGALEMNFTFYIIVNLVCKLIENILIVFFSKTASESNIWLYAYIAISVIAFAIGIILTVIERGKKLKNRATENVD